jgi:hypothetical protein
MNVDQASPNLAQVAGPAAEDIAGVVGGGGGLKISRFVSDGVCHAGPFRILGWDQYSLCLSPDSLGDGALRS